MTATVDARYEALGLLGHEGAVSDRVMSWLLSQLPEGSAGTIGDLWDQLFDQDAIPTGARPERLLWWLQAQGHALDALPDANHEFWNDMLLRSTLWNSPL